MAWAKDNLPEPTIPDLVHADFVNKADEVFNGEQWDEPLSRPDARAIDGREFMGFANAVDRLAELAPGHLKANDARLWAAELIFKQWSIENVQAQFFRDGEPWSLSRDDLRPFRPEGEQFNLFHNAGLKLRDFSHVPLFVAIQDIVRLERKVRSSSQRRPAIEDYVLANQERAAAELRADGKTGNGRPLETKLREMFREEWGVLPALGTIHQALVAPRKKAPGPAQNR